MQRGIFIKNARSIQFLCLVTLVLFIGFNLLFVLNKKGGLGLGWFRNLFGLGFRVQSSWVCVWAVGLYCAVVELTVGLLTCCFNQNPR